MLEKRDGYPEREIYVSPRAEWSRYDAEQIESVTLWVNEDTGTLSKKERQMLTDTLYGSLHQQLGAQFRIANSPGPSVLRLRAALTQARGANVPLRTMTTVVPQLRVISTATGMASDAAVTVGAGTPEAELLDSVTGERLVAVVDSRAGNKALLTTRTFKEWGDFEAAADYWAKRATYALAQLGVRRKPGAPEPRDP